MYSGSSRIRDPLVNPVIGASSRGASRSRSLATTGSADAGRRGHAADELAPPDRLGRAASDGIAHSRYAATRLFDPRERGGPRSYTGTPSPGTRPLTREEIDRRLFKYGALSADPARYASMGLPSLPQAVARTGAAVAERARTRGVESGTDALSSTRGGDLSRSSRSSTRGVESGTDALFRSGSLTQDSGLLASGRNAVSVGSARPKLDWLEDESSPSTSSGLRGGAAPDTSGSGEGFLGRIRSALAPSSRDRGVIELDKGDPSAPRGLVGLYNQGNTCFLNSALQCCLNTPPLLALLLDRATPKLPPNARSSTKGNMARAACALARRMWGSPGAAGAERPSDVKAVVGRVASRFLGFDQQDAQEFLRFFLDALHEDLCRVHGKVPYKELDDPASMSDSRVADEWWDYDASRNDSPVRDIFAGQLCSVVECCGCGRRSRAFDTFWDLVIPIPRGAQVKGLRRVAASDTCSLEDCLAEFARDETLGSSEGYKCKECRSDKSRKRMGLWRCPPALVLVLKRFTFSTYRRAKITTPVGIASGGRLDLAPYCSPGCEFRKRCDVCLSRHC
jgi:hypothetical protein